MKRSETKLIETNIRQSPALPGFFVFRSNALMTARRSACHIFIRSFTRCRFDAPETLMPRKHLRVAPFDWRAMQCGSNGLRFSILKMPRGSYPEKQSRKASLR
jgi:hypothetical protein